MHNDNDTPEVWVGCLACYNAGRLIGQWYDALEAGELTPEQLHEGRLAQLEARDGGSPHEELWVMDHQGFGGLLTGECSPMEAQRLAEVIGELEDANLPVEAFAAWLQGEANSGAVSDFGDVFQGVWDSEEDFARQMSEDIGDTGSVPEGAAWLLQYVDWERVARDLMMDFGSEHVSGGVAIWRS